MKGTERSPDSPPGRYTPLGRWPTSQFQGGNALEVAVCGTAAARLCHIALELWEPKPSASAAAMKEVWQRLQMTSKGNGHRTPQFAFMFYIYQLPAFHVCTYLFFSDVWPYFIFNQSKSSKTCGNYPPHRVTKLVCRRERRWSRQETERRGGQRCYSGFVLGCFIVLS